MALREDLTLTRAEIGKAFRIPEPTLRRWIRQGHIEETTDGRLIVGEVLELRANPPRKGRPPK